MATGYPSTGLTGLDDVLTGLRPGDNVVWQVESIPDYLEFVAPYCARARDSGCQVVYFRFARHAPLLQAGGLVEVCELQPQDGFETFINSVHRAIRRHGEGSYLVFDCLSDLAADWYSDQMLANFFMLTCPFILEIRALAYFALLRNAHSPQATVPITETTQILIDVFRREPDLFVCPRKVDGRYSPTMFMVHVVDTDGVRPLTYSAHIAGLMAGVPWLRSDWSGQTMDVWSRTLRDAESALDEVDRGEGEESKNAGRLRHLLRMVFSRDERVLEMAEQFLDLRAVLGTARRMVGTGLIGGKSVGMLLARAILAARYGGWASGEEAHDSFFVGSDVFYTFLVRNGCWWIRERQRSAGALIDAAETAQERIRNGTFPDYVMRSFSDILEYFGQSPIIVRSSSLLEDNFGNAFSGKYESVFCPNQGTHARRLERFLDAVRTVYASSMSREALAYRANRGLLDRDEQMALLVQRVSGHLHGNLFFPDIAGVGYSHNPYAWSPEIDPEAGMLRLVFGLGTRAVDRNDDDYTRIVALNAPLRRPEAGSDNARRFTQHRVDVLDLQGDRLVAMDFEDVGRASPALPLQVLADRDPSIEEYARRQGLRDVYPWVLTFGGLFSKTTFVADMKQMLRVLEKAYQYPVDVEFSANRSEDGRFRVNLLQCRPFPVRMETTRRISPVSVSASQLVLQGRGPVIGHSRVIQIRRIVLVRAAPYDHLSLTGKYSVARLVGRLLHLDADSVGGGVLLIGPGRWGTTTPSLGVPVTFAEINTVSVLCELVTMREGLVPDVSLGTHFFNDLVEQDILYVGIFPEQAGNLLNEDLLLAAPNRLPALLPDSEASAGVVHVADSSDLAKAGHLTLSADALTQHIICGVEQD